MGSAPESGALSMNVETSFSLLNAYDKIYAKIDNCSLCFLKVIFLTHAELAARLPLMLMALKVFSTRQSPNKFGWFMNQDWEMLGANPVLLSLVFNCQQRYFLAAPFTHNTSIFLLGHARL